MQSGSQISSVDKMSAGKEKDAHCFICEDGGDMLECTICNRSFCHSILGEEGDDVDALGCVTVPRPFAKDEYQSWPCPECLSKVQARTAPYIINRGARNTMRISSPGAVVLIVFHIRSLTELAQSVYEQIVALLSAFEMNVAAARCLLHQGVSKGTEAELLKQLGPGVEYHLAIVAVTESHPGGGWWWHSKHGNQDIASVSETQFLEECRFQVLNLAKRASTCRWFFAACGMNLPGPSTIELIRKALLPTSFLSIVLPTATNIMLSDYAHVLPEVFLNLYYYGADLRSACYRVWGKSIDARYHTGLLLVDRKTARNQFSITKVAHSSSKHRPYGVSLPDVSSLCGCPEYVTQWNFKTEIPHGSELIYIYMSSCRHTQLRVAIHPSRRRIVRKFDAEFMEEDWVTETCSFEFQESRMVRMLTLDGATAGKMNKKELGRPWTIAGRSAAIKANISRETTGPGAGL